MANLGLKPAAERGIKAGAVVYFKRGLDEPVDKGIVQAGPAQPDHAHVMVQEAPFNRTTWNGTVVEVEHAKLFTPEELIRGINLRWRMDHEELERVQVREIDAVLGSRVGNALLRSTIETIAYEEREEPLSA